MTTQLLQTIVHREFPAAQRGDRHAYSRLVSATQRMVTSIALAVVRDVQLSEDIAQETFLTGWQRLAQMHSSDSFLPWLREVTRNRAIDQLRSLRRRERSHPHSDPELSAVADLAAGPPERLMQEQDSALLSQALDEIPAESREVLLLFYRQGQSSRDVASLLGLSDAAVRKRLQRARLNLQSELLQHLGTALCHSAPGLGFTATVVAGLGAPTSASAAGAGFGGLLKAGSKLLLGAIGALLGAIAVVLLAVGLEVRGDLRRHPVSKHRALIRHGLLYGLLMTAYVALLWWSARHGWSRGQVLAVAAVVSVAIVALAMRKHFLLRERPNGSDDR